MVDKGLLWCSEWLLGCSELLIRGCYDVTRTLCLLACSELLL